MGEWLTVPEILAAGHPALPSDRRELDRMALEQGWRADPRRARLIPGAGRAGGTWEYDVSVLPVEARVAVLTAAAAANDTAPEPPSKLLWERFERLSEAQKAEARRRLAALDRVATLSRDMSRQLAVALVARELGCGVRTLWDWDALARGVRKADRLAALAPRRQGRTATSDCDPRAWDFLKALWLQPESRVFDSCDRRMREAAAEHGWGPIPSAKTLKRRLEREIPRGVQILARKGADAARALYPAQTRDRSCFAPLEAVNADGHRFDVFVKWPDGTMARPVMVAIQDLYSGLIVGWRVGRTENWTAVRHAFADMVESFGVPEAAYLDNGRGFAAKWLTGGAKTRFRFKIRDDEPEGVLTALGIRVHWTTPYHGQSKPIERAFGDLAEEVAKHPSFAGAYVGKSPMAKPENYGSAAVPFELFRATLASEIRRHNERAGRRGGNTRGRSFAETWRDGLASGLPVRRATEAQRRMLMLAADGVTARKGNGEIHLGGNRYWTESLVDVAGRKVTVRFDPDDLFKPVAVYAQDGRFVAEAECIDAAGFTDMAAAQEQARAVRQYLKAHREMLALERRMSIDVAARLTPQPAPYAVPESPRVIRLVANGRPEPTEPDGWSGSEAFGAGIRRLADVVPFAREE